VILVEIKRGTRVCSKEIGGCGRQIFQGEWAWQQFRSGKGKSTRYLCEQCAQKVFINGFASKVNSKK